MSFTFNPGRARWLAPMSLALAVAAGCSETAELAGALSSENRERPGRPANGSSATGTAPGASSGSGGAPATGGTTGRGGAVECKMRGDGPNVCVICVDVASGKVVRDDCQNRMGDPMGAQCAETREPDGSTCVVCKDATGNVIKRGCQTPPTACPVPPPPMPDPMGGACRESEMNGLKCTVCYDPNGKEIKRWCQDPGGRPPEPVTCQETSYPDGTTCAVCTDARGNIVKKGCWSPVPQPTMPSMVTCKEYMENGARCSICVDEKGMVLRQGCGPVSTPDPNTMPPPPPGMMPPPPATVPAITCQRYQNATSVCTICVDQAGKIVKQDCQPVAPPPPR